MIAAMLADLERFFEVGFKQRGITLVAFDEDAFGLDHALFGGHALDLLILFTKPRHKRR
jgi:hypothetical protein